MKPRLPLGVNVSKGDYRVALLKNNKLHHSVFVNTADGYTQFNRWLRGHQIKVAHVCMVSPGGVGDKLAVRMQNNGHTVSIVNEFDIAVYGGNHPSGTPSEDLLAHFCADTQPPPWVAPDPGILALRALSRDIAEAGLHGPRVDEPDGPDVR